MTGGASLEYALVTPARNELQNLTRLASSVVAQRPLPAAWVIVDDGSTDGTRSLAERLAEEHSWIRVVAVPGEHEQIRGAPIVRAVHAGLEELDPWPDVVVKLDADVSFATDHFARLLASFAADPRLGIASSLCLEQTSGLWRPTYSTRSHARGAVRAYRRECLKEVLPLEERLGWDGIDELRAAVRGWRTATIFDVAFYHHRNVGQREAAYARWRRQGETAHYMGYRPSYLVVRALYRALREPSALAMVHGYWAAAVRCSPRYHDREVREFLRREQSLRRLPRRAREALGRTT